MEIKLAELSDLVAPITKFTNNKSAELQVVAPHIKKKLNLRRSLLKILKRSPNGDLKK